MGRPDETEGEAGVAATTSTLPRASVPREAVATLAAGDTVGRYRVLEVLGAGGMGVVYGAFDPELQRKVALKLVRAELTDAELRARLWREAQAMARIRHPNVITVFDVGTWNDQVFVAMEVIDGWTLSSWQAARSRSVDEILRVMAAAGAGLAAAHAVGLVHRDFKPDNVLIGGDGRVCVTDFGLARAVAMPSEIEEPSSPDATVEGELTRQGALVGTPAYMAPEQMRGTAPDGRADQFSFCVALYEALYGVRPFPGMSLGELERAIFEGDRLRPRRKGVPASVRRALARGLSFAADDRFPSMDELLRALAPARRMVPAALVAALVGVAVACVTVAAGVVHFRGDRARMCRGAADKLAGVWDGPRRAAVAAALGGDEPRARDRAARVLAALDDYAARWVRGYTDACEATHVRGEQSEALLDLRMQCLDGRRREAEELTRILASDRELGDKAAQAAHSLPPVAACADVAALARPQQAPKAAQAELEVPRRLLARARAELNARQVRRLAHQRGGGGGRGAPARRSDAGGERDAVAGARAALPRRARGLAHHARRRVGAGGARARRGRADVPDLRGRRARRAAGGVRRRRALGDARRRRGGARRRRPVGRGRSPVRARHPRVAAQPAGAVGGVPPARGQALRQDRRRRRVRSAAQPRAAGGGARQHGALRRGAAAAEGDPRSLRRAARARQHRHPHARREHRARRVGGGRSRRRRRRGRGASSSAWARPARRTSRRRRPTTAGCSSRPGAWARPSTGFTRRWPRPIASTGGTTRRPSSRSPGSARRTSRTASRGWRCRRSSARSACSTATRPRPIAPTPSWRWRRR